MQRLDTPGCYRAVRWVVLGMLALPFVAFGCFALEGIRVERCFRTAEGAFRRDLEHEKLIGASRAHVLSFLRRTGLDKTIHPRARGTTDITARTLENTRIEKLPAFWIDTPGAACGSPVFDFCFSEVELRFDRRDRLVGYRFPHRAAMVL